MDTMNTEGWREFRGRISPVLLARVPLAVRIGETMLASGEFTAVEVDALGVLVGLGRRFERLATDGGECEVDRADAGREEDHELTRMDTNEHEGDGRDGRDGRDGQNPHPTPLPGGEGAAGADDSGVPW